jgi:protein-tyrosine phosphatase
MTIILEYEKTNQPFLYLTSYKEAYNKEYLKNNKITNIINISSETKCLYEEEIKYLHLKLNDEEKEEISKHFEECWEFMDKVNNNKEVILIHCQVFFF